MVQPTSKRLVTENRLGSMIGNSRARYGGPPVTSQVDVNRFTAPNGSKLTSIVTYQGGNNEVVEPTVWYDPNGLFGYEYWMSAGPYEASNAAFENPSMWVSHDGITWSIPPGSTNPVVAAPAGGNYDDPHLVEVDGVLYVIWNWSRTGGLGDQILMSSTTDGITWTTPVALRTSSDGSAHEYLSPHVEYWNGLWYMWTLSLLAGTRVIYRSTCATLTGTWSAGTTCTTPLPSGKDHWEFEVRRVGGEWWMLENVVDTGGTAAGGQLRLRSSADGLVWNLSRRPILTGSAVASSFDENFIYKASFVPMEDGRIAIWYSAGSGGTLRWSIGFTIADAFTETNLNTGSWYAPPTTVGTATMTAGTGYYLPIYLDKAVSLQALGLEVTVVASGGGGASAISLGLYDDNGKGRPGRLIVDAGTILGTSATLQTVATSQVVGPGLVWLASLNVASATTPPTVRVATSVSQPIGTTSTLASQNNLSGLRQTGLAALPAVATPDQTLATGNTPRLIYQAT